MPAPAQFGGEVTKIRNAPELGADTDDVLGELGSTRLRWLCSAVGAILGCDHHEES